MEKANPVEAEKFIQRKLFAFNAGKTLARAFNAGENVLLTGPGGYGKTDGAYLFFTYLKTKGLLEDEVPYILAFGQGMTEERLFAGIDIKKFKSQGEIVYNLKKAFVNYEYVIFEELFDAFPGVLLILKDVLQSKSVRLGSTVFPMRTKFIVACTNRSYDEVVSDRSTHALMERFVFQKEVVWSSWEKNDYVSAFECDIGEKADLIATSVAIIAASSNKADNKISPRTASKGLKAVRNNNNDLSVLEDIIGFDKKAIAEVIQSLNSLKEDELQLEYVNSVLVKCNLIQKEAFQLRSAIKVAMNVKKIHMELVELRNMQKRDACKEMIVSTINTIETLRDALWHIAQSLIIKPKRDSLVWHIKHTTAESFNWDLIRL